MDIVSIFSLGGTMGAETWQTIALVIMSLNIEHGIRKREKARIAADIVKEEKREAAQKEFADKLVNALTEHDQKNEKRFITLETFVGFKRGE